MSVYVDDARWPYRGMLMCHMWADSLEELYAMVDRIGVDRRWIQRPPKASWVHFDIAKNKRAMAVRFGAVECDELAPLIHRARLAGDHDQVRRWERLRRQRHEQRA